MSDIHPRTPQTGNVSHESETLPPPANAVPVPPGNVPSVNPPLPPGTSGNPGTGGILNPASNQGNDPGEVRLPGDPAPS